MLRLHSLETFGTHDGPGIRLVIFVQGCNMRCLYCHNADTQEVQGGQEYSTKSLLHTLEKQRSYFGTTGGLTISGGEPLMQADGVLNLIQEAHAAGFHTALDTNGSIWSEAVQDVYKEVDLVLFDVKQMNDVKHCELTGVGNDNILKSIAYRESLNKPMWLRYVLVPGYTDAEVDLESFGQYFKDYKNVERVEVLPYHNFGAYKFKELGREYKLENVERPSDESIVKTKNILDKYFKMVIIA